MNQVVPNTPSISHEAFKAKHALYEISKGDVFVPNHDIIRLFKSAGENVLQDPSISQNLKDIYLESLPLIEDVDLEEIKDSILQRLVDTMKGLIK